MVTDKGRVKLVDFGVAHTVEPENETMTTSFLKRDRDARFCALKQYVKGSRTDITSDIYSLGATMYAMFTRETHASRGGTGHRTGDAGIPGDHRQRTAVASGHAHLQDGWRRRSGSAARTSKKERGPYPAPRTQRDDGCSSPGSYTSRRRKGAGLWEPRKCPKCAAEAQAQLELCPKCGAKFAEERRCRSRSSVRRSRTQPTPNARFRSRSK